MCKEVTLQCALKERFEIHWVYGRGLPFADTQRTMVLIGGA